MKKGLILILVFVVPLVYSCFCNCPKNGINHIYTCKKIYFRSLSGKISPDTLHYHSDSAVSMEMELTSVAMKSVAGCADLMACKCYTRYSFKDALDSFTMNIADSVSPDLRKGKNISDWFHVNPLMGKTVRCDSANSQLLWRTGYPRSRFTLTLDSMPAGMKQLTVTGNLYISNGTRLETMPCTWIL
ncbi:MAG: hypothetical protein JNL57_11945 [Bacteroidetes bacterium]|nr:hypothetical protein [Bacteroidota bacterium]